MKTITVPFKIDVELQKDLQDDEEICPVCHGTGVVIRDNAFGVDDNKNERFPYKQQTIESCVNCYNGVVKTCGSCGKLLSNRYSECNCEESMKTKNEEQKQRNITNAQKLYDKAEKISLNDALKKFTYLYVEETDQFLPDDGDEIDEVPIEYHIFGTETQTMSIDAYDIVENACEEMGEDAMDRVNDTDSLQDIINEWIDKNGTSCYVPNYNFAVVRTEGADK